ncbi:uncharacterized protein isoform X3 [Musca autumnalis]|uniref:uncharacterized protein isoform X3 n=1 Tax=Musca autumnalis TaxID=221902 RepID=UPI003CFAB377
MKCSNKRAPKQRGRRSTGRTNTHKDILPTLHRESTWQPTYQTTGKSKQAPAAPNAESPAALSTNEVPNNAHPAISLRTDQPVQLNVAQALNVVNGAGQITGISPE